MLPRAQRLTTTAFAKAFREGRVLRHPLVQMRAHRRHKNAPKSGAATGIELQSTLSVSSSAKSSSTVLRAAFVVPKKLGPATFRNHLRRRMSEAYLRVGQADADDVLQIGGLAGCDLIFVATPAASKAGFTELSEAISQLLRRAKNR